MPGIEAFSREGPSDEGDYLVLNAPSIPLIEAGIANIKLGVFSVVSRRLATNWEDPKKAIALTHAIKCELFGESPDPLRLGDIVPNADCVLSSEIDVTLGDESIREAIALAYAAEIIAHAWRTGSARASLLSSSAIVERATNHGIEIQNIVELWGSSAINTFFVSSVDFLQRSVVLENL